VLNTIKCGKIFSRKTERKRSAQLLSVGIKYSTPDLVCDVISKPYILKTDFSRYFSRLSWFYLLYTCKQTIVRVVKKIKNHFYDL